METKWYQLDIVSKKVRDAKSHSSNLVKKSILTYERESAKFIL